MKKLFGKIIDREHSIAAYRRVMAELDDQTTEGGKARHRDIAESMRDLWKMWQGDDSLHETTFGVNENSLHAAPRDISPAVITDWPRGGMVTRVRSVIMRCLIVLWIVFLTTTAAGCVTTTTQTTTAASGLPHSEAGVGMSRMRP